jgi:hypothetical protein
MTLDRDDPILDACLEEVLGGRKPPDLTDRILLALGRREAGAVGAEAEDLPVIVGLAASGRANGQPVSFSLRSTRHHGPRRSQVLQWAAVAVAVGGLGVAIGLSALFWALSGDQRQPLANQPKAPSKQAPVIGHDSKYRRERPDLPDQKSGTGQLAKGQKLVPEVIPLEVPPVPRSESDAPQPPRPAAQPLSESALIAFVNTQIEESWRKHGVTPAAAAIDSEWCKRVYLRLLGRAPTPAETATFVDDTSADKRRKLVDAIMDGPAHREQFARHWAGVWTNVLIGRGGDGSPASREGLEQYLVEAYLADKPYDQIVRELLTATGTNRPGTPEFNGAVNFLLASLGEDAAPATARISRVFLGHQLQCAQCHDHQQWTQQQFWSLNAFLRQVQPQRAGDAMRLADADFVARPGVTGDREVYYQLPSGELKAAEPQFLDGTRIPAGGRLAEVDRRAALADLVVRSPQLPRALVNRLWGHFFGYGFVRPLDDLASPGAASHPAVLDRLAEQFAAHGYDLKQAMRWIVLSEPFARASDIPAGGLKDAPEAGTTPLFSRYYVRPPAAENLVRSLQVAADLRQKTAGDAAQLAKARVDWLAQLFRRSADATDDQQQLLLLSGRQLVSPRQEEQLKKVMEGGLPAAQKVEHLFLAAISRKPTPQEQQVVAAILAGAGQDPSALEDIWWALVHSSEFVLDP